MAGPTRKAIGREQDGQDVDDRHGLPAALTDQYATKFSQAALEDMLAFFRTDGGRALIAQTPAIVRERFVLGRSLAKTLADDLANEFRSRHDCAQ